MHIYIKLSSFEVIMKRGKIHKIYKCLGRYNNIQRKLTEEWTFA